MTQPTTTAPLATGTTITFVSVIGSTPTLYTGLVVELFAGFYQIDVTVTEELGKAAVTHPRPRRHVVEAHLVHAA